MYNIYIIFISRFYGRNNMHNAHLVAQKGSSVLWGLSKPENCYADFSVYVMLTMLYVNTPKHHTLRKM